MPRKGAEIALSPLTEAAQSRLTFIPGPAMTLVWNQYRDDIRVDSPSNQARAQDYGIREGAGSIQ
jgi:hypothetical protein